MKNNYVLNNFRYICNTAKFKLILSLLFINSLYGGFIVVQPGIDSGYVSTLLNIYINPYFLMILLIIIIFNMFIVYNIISNNNEYIIRLKNKDEYIKVLIKNVLFNTFVIYIIQLILILTIINIFYSQSSGIGELTLGINNLTYAIFFIIKVYLLIKFLLIISIYLLEFINKIVVLVINFFIYISIPIGSNFFVIKFKSITIPTYIGTYFSIYPYEDFLSELSSTIIFILFLYLITIIIKKAKGWNF